MLTGGFSKRMTFSFVHDGTDLRNLVLSDDKQTRFIKDTVRFHIPEQGVEVVKEIGNVAQGAAEGINKNMLANTFQTFPIKAWLKIRYYQAKLRKVKPGSKKEKRYQEKMQNTKQFYNQYFGI